MAHPAPAPLRALARIVRALASIAALAVIVAGIPLTLLATGHQPTELAGHTDLLAQDDGTLWLVVFTCIGWIAWAAFSFSALVESVALARRRSAPRIKGLGSMQSLASFLIGGIVLLIPTAASAATTPALAATAVSVSAQAPTSDSVSHAAPATSDTATVQQDAGPQHTVTKSTELPWDLAEEYLGDGTRWKDIAALNPAIPELAAGDQYLPKGAVITLPADAHTSAEATAPASSDRADHGPGAKGAAGQTARDDADGSGSDSTTHDEYTVRANDSLSGIAQKVGGGVEWKDIYDLNKGNPQPYGQTFTDPDLIYPDQVLALPASRTDDSTKPPAQRQEHPGHKPTAQSPDTTTPEGHEPAAKTPQRDTGSEPAAPTTAPSQAAPTTPAQQGKPTTAQPTAAGEDETGSLLASAAVWEGAGALAAAVITTLGTRRILQQRRRRHGRRIPMPQGRAAATEQGLRAAQHPGGFALLNTALRTLARNLADLGKELPDLQAVVLHESKVELHLSHDQAAVKPFTAAAARRDLWVCTAASTDLATPEELRDTDAPYPALVSLGWDGQGHLVLVDLEHVGILNLSGDADFARHVLQAIAIELANTPLPGHLEITTVAATAPHLEDAVPGRVAHQAEVSAASAELADHSADQRQALALLGAPNLRSARLLEDAGDSWTPHIVLAHDLPDTPDTTELLATLAEEPRTAGAVITANASLDLPAHTWSLTCQGPEHTVVLPGSQLPIKLQGLSDDHFADAVDILTLAGSDADVPAPEWTEPDEQHEGTLEDAALPAAALHAPAVEDEDVDEDGFPTEYGDPDMDDAEASDEPTPAAANSAPVLTKTAQPDGQASDEDQEQTSGQSLADVLAAEQHIDNPPTAAEPQQHSATATPCTQAPARDTIHVTIPKLSTPTPVTADTRQSTDAAPKAEGPAIQVLGPVTIEGATGRIDTSRRSVAVELICFLALHNGVDRHAIDEALWPGTRVGKKTRDPWITRARSWLGKDADGNPYLPPIQDSHDRLYRVSPAASCDWASFQHFARTGLARTDEDGDLALRRALALVKGRPFSAINPLRYAWAEPFVQEMVSAIVDAAHELSVRRREAGDPAGALWAAGKGLLAAEENESLHREVFRAHHSTGDMEALRAAAARLARINEHLGDEEHGGVDMDTETAALLHDLLPRPAARAR